MYQEYVEQQKMRILYLLLIGIVQMQCTEADSYPETPPPGELSSECTENAYGTLLESSTTIAERLSVSAENVLTRVAEVRSFQAQYATENWAVEQSPLGGETLLTRTIEFSGGEIREQQKEGCPAWLDIEATVSVETEDGSFYERWPIVIRFDYDQNISILGYFDPKEISGTFEILSYLRPAAPERVSGRFIESYDEYYSYNITGSIDISTSGSAGQDGVGISSNQRTITWSTESEVDRK